jgi:hypothetical protein
MLNNKFTVWLLEIGIYLVIGAWCLVIIKLFKSFVLIFLYGFPNHLVLDSV